jgi:hypothetical protein
MTWQMPVMFLITATICMVVGMFLLVWSATSHLATPGLWDDQTKVLFWMLELLNIIEANLTYIGCNLRWADLFILAYQEVRLRVLHCSFS